jgi:hypothetical protein
MYLVNTRSDICFVVNTLSQYMVEPRHVHWIETKHVLRYLHGTVGYGLRYVSDGEVKLQGYTDSDWVGSAVDQKITSGCCFNLGSGMISWLSRKRHVSGTQYNRGRVYCIQCCNREAVWLQKLLVGLFDLELEPTLIHCDNQSCVNILENPIFHDKLKHIEIKYHYI